jgi:hypothetical protein
MFPFFTREAKLSLVLHVGSHSVAGAFVKYEKGRAPRLFTTVRERLSDDSKLKNEEELKKEFSKTLKRLVERLLRESAPIALRAHGSARPEAVYVTFSSPWQKISLLKKTVREKEPFLITKKDLAQLARESLEGHPDNPSMRIVHRSLLRVLVNGYPVKRPVGKRAKEVVVFSLIEEVQRDVCDEVLRSLKENFHQDDVECRAFSSASYHAIERFFPYEKNYLFIEVAGTATTVVFVRDGDLCCSELIPRGVHGGSEERKRWTEEMTTALEKIAGGIPVPQTVFLAIYDSYRADFAKAILDIDTLRIRLGTKAFTIVPIQDSLLREHVVYRPDAAPDLFLALSTLIPSEE